MQYRFASWGTFLAIVVAAAPASAQRFVEEARYGATDPGPFPSGFGAAVAMDLQTSVIGAPGALSGAGQVFFHDVSGATPIFLDSFDIDSAGALGFSVAVRGNLIVVGAPLTPVEERVERGRVFVFGRNDGPTVSLIHVLSPPTSAGPGRAQFGASVAFAGTDAIVVGAPGISSVYWYDSVSSSSPTVRTSLSMPSISGFGGAVAAGPLAGLSRTLVAIGSDDRVTPRPVTLWVVGASSTPPSTIPNPGGEAGFGASVAVDGLRVMIGSPIASIVRIYEGDSVATLALVERYDGSAGSGLGASVALHGELRVAGAPGVTPTAIGDTGEAYLLRPEGVAPRAAVRTSSRAAMAVGASVALVGNRLLVGAPDGSDAVLFRDTSPRACSGSGECAGYEVCVEGFCCNHACGEAPQDCHACDIAGIEGWCAYEPASTTCTTADGLCAGVCTGDVLECTESVVCSAIDAGARGDGDGGNAERDSGGLIANDSAGIDAASAPPGTSFAGGGGCRCGAAGTGHPGWGLAWWVGLGAASYAHRRRARRNRRLHSGRGRTDRLRS